MLGYLSVSVSDPLSSYMDYGISNVRMCSCMRIIHTGGPQFTVSPERPLHRVCSTPENSRSVDKNLARNGNRLSSMW